MEKGYGLYSQDTRGLSLLGLTYCCDLLWGQCWVACAFVTGGTEDIGYTFPSISETADGACTPRFNVIRVGDDYQYTGYWQGCHVDLHYRSSAFLCFLPPIVNQRARARPHRHPGRPKG